MRVMIIVCWLALTATASANTLLVDPAGAPIGGKYQTWVNQSMVPTPSATVVIDFDPSHSTEDRTYIEVEGDHTIHPVGSLTRGDLMHELGHLYDYDLLNDSDRSEIMHRVLHRHGDWRSPPNSPHEQFAEAYRLAASRRPSYWNVGYDLNINNARLMLLRQWLINIPIVHALALG